MRLPLEEPDRVGVGVLVREEEALNVGVEESVDVAERVLDEDPVPETVQVEELEPVCV